MILVDTSVWVQHLRHGDAHLASLLDAGQVLGHPWVVGELALGHLRQRADVLSLLGRLPQAPVATPAETLLVIDAHQLQGSGIGYVDVQLLAATRLVPESGLWTLDKRLAGIAVRLGHGYRPPEQACG